MDPATQEYIGATASTLFVPLVVAIGSVVAGRRARREGRDALETVLRWWLIGGMVVGAVIIALSFWVVPGYMADSMGYTRSPFQFEVSVANLAFAVMGLLCVRNRAARPVAVTGFCVFMWFAMLGHVYQLVRHGNSTAGNGAGIWIYDLLVPLVLLFLVLRQARQDADRHPARRSG